MDAKITKQRLSRMLSYDWVKIVLSIVGLILVWALVFSITSTKITSSQQFTVYNYIGNRGVSDSKYYTSYDKAYKDGIFSYEVIETDTYDLAATPDYASTLLEAHLGVDEGDVIFAANTWNTETKYEENGETKYKYTYLQQFVSGYRHQLYTLDRNAEGSFFMELQNYLNTFYNGDYTKAENLDEAKVEREFRARIKKNKDKRFRKESLIKAGIPEEIERIKKYRDALVEYDGYLASGYIQTTNVEIVDNENKVVAEGIYGLNLCPTAAKDKMSKLSDIVSYPMSYQNEDGQTETVYTAENMNVCLFKMKSVEKGFQFESLLYVNYLIRTCLAA